MHFHNWAVSLDLFEKSPKIKEMMRITQIGTLVEESGNKIEFINCMEAKDYPIYTTMYHPEYQLADFIGEKKMFEQSDNW